MNSPKRKIVLIAHNIRSTHNIGAIFRTCEGFGVEKIIISGYTPFPKIKNETFNQTGRMPFIADKIHQQIAKTALGAEEIVDFSLSKDILTDIDKLKSENYKIVALEQGKNSIMINDFKPEQNQKIALILGEEVNGVPDFLLEASDQLLEIPMFGQKESFNVSVAAGIALYRLACE